MSAGVVHTCPSSLCCPAGEIMISAMGDAEGKPKGGFVLLDEDFKVVSLPCLPCKVIILATPDSIKAAVLYR